MIDLNLKELSTEDLKNLERKIKYETTEREEKKIKEMVKKHDSLIGKCFKAKIHTPYILFPEMWKYYKIINSRASNEYRVSALIFEEYPTYWFYYDRGGNHFFGHYDFKGIRTDDFPFYCYDWNDTSEHRDAIVGDNLIEIPLEEYNEAMNTYINRLQKLDWPADHYRGKSRIPGDPGWKEESK